MPEQLAAHTANAMSGSVPLQPGQTQSRKAQLPALGALAIVCVALFPVWQWYFSRLSESGTSIRSWLPLALLAHAAIAISRSRTRAADRHQLQLVQAVAVLTAICMPVAPHLISGILGLTLTGMCASLLLFQTIRLPYVSLYPLGLPALASIQFFGGYPLRLVTAWMTWLPLRPVFPSLTLEGVNFRLGDLLISVDAPCSGIRMMWTGWLLVAVLAMVYRVRTKAFIMALFLSLPVMVLANSIRATGLVLIKVNHLDAPILHSTIGLCAFFAGAGLLWLVIRFLPLRFPAAKSPAVPDLPEPHAGQSCRMHNPVSACLTTAVLVAIGAVLTTLMPDRSLKEVHQPLTQATLAEWTDALPAIYMENPQIWTPAEPDQVQKAFADRFPGSILQLESNGNTMIVRWIQRASRRVHPAMECFRASGY